MALTLIANFLRVRSQTSLNWCPNGHQLKSECATIDVHSGINWRTFPFLILSGRKSKALWLTNELRGLPAALPPRRIHRLEICPIFPYSTCQKSAVIPYFDKINFAVSLYFDQINFAEWPFLYTFCEEILLHLYKIRVILRYSVMHYSAFVLPLNMGQKWFNDI